MKRDFLFGIFCAIVLTAGAQVTPQWLRNCAISPDGTSIAFTYMADIYIVPSQGGEAKRITTNSAYDTAPVWSPDSKTIAFASNRNGSTDVFIVSREGGVAKRVTTNSASETPVAFLNNNEILFAATMLPDNRYGEFPNANQIFKVNIDASRPVLFSSENMEAIDIDAKGRILYHDKKGYEDTWRKHHRSSITRDVWVTNCEGERSYTRLTDFDGEDRYPVWGEGDTFYYLSERNGTFNVFRSSVSNSKETQQITKHEKHPVRFLTAADNGTLCYGYDGDIYTFSKGGKPQKVNISITTDIYPTDRRTMTFSSGVTAIAPSKNGKEVAFVLRGDVFVTTADHSTTRRITDTPEQERNIDISPDGRTIVYSSERNGVWGIYTTTIVRKEDKYFTYAAEFKEEPLVVGSKAAFQPTFSPDGKEVAFLEDRTTLRVINLKSKKIRTVLDGKFNYSYRDGDVSYSWSPDSRWFLTSYIGIGGWNNSDIALVKADGKGEIHNLTESGYNDSNARWALDGKAMIWSSDRAGYRSHGSWGAHRDVYIMFFDAEAYDKFHMNKEELVLYEEAEKERKEKEEKEKKEAEEKKKKKEKEKKEGKEEKEKKNEEVEPLEFDLENRRDRIVRLTRSSSALGDAVLSKKGDKLYYIARFGTSTDLWERDLQEGSEKAVSKGFGYATLHPDKEVGKIYAASGGIKYFSTSGNSVKNISFSAEFIHKPIAERKYIFDHIWRQVKDKFYDANIHGVDWEFYGKEYSKFLPHITNSVDFAEMLSELLGELNASHTGARSRIGSSYQTAVFGAFYDETHKGKGLKIKEIINQSPLEKAKSKIKCGCIIEEIDGNIIEKDMDYYPLLEEKAGKRVRLTIYNPESKERFEEWIKPITASQQNALLYKRWVEKNRAMTDSLSGGKIGYIHIKGMDSESFRNTYSELLGRYRNHEAVLIDTRHNGGGWLHEDLAILLSGKEYQRFTPRGQYIGSDPFAQWFKPSAVLICEDNYSNAHGFPTVYKALGIGKLIGAPVPGTMTAVWWETQIDPSIVFGVPQTTVTDMQGNVLENNELQPDIEVYNTPEERNRGIDRQIEAGVKHLLEVIARNNKQ